MQSNPAAERLAAAYITDLVIRHADSIGQVYYPERVGDIVTDAFTVDTLQYTNMQGVPVRRYVLIGAEEVDHLALRQASQVTRLDVEADNPAAVTAA
jgi:hypothetical protein